MIGPWLGGVFSISRLDRIKVWMSLVASLVTEMGRAILLTDEQ